MSFWWRRLMFWLGLAEIPPVTEHEFEKPVVDYEMWRKNVSGGEE